MTYAVSLGAQYFFARSVSRSVLFDTNIAIYVATTIVVIVSLWFIFEKADLPRWAAIVPLYNIAMLYRLVGRSPRESALLLFPVYNVYLYIRLMHEISRAFGGDRVFTAVLVISPFIGFPMMASRRATYRATGPAAI
jgi:hypothetical protein